MKRKNERSQTHLFPFSGPVARILTYLLKADTSTSIDLESITGLRQPEVSIAMRELKPLDWINENEEKKPDKGRLNKVRSKDIKAHLENQQKKSN